jgi:hypothetical protein
MADNVDSGDGAVNKDPFGFGELREAQTLLQVRRRRLHVPVRRKPNRLDFVRVHPSPEYRLDVPLFRLQADGGDEEMYYVHPSMIDEIRSECRWYKLFTAVNLNGSVFLWCVPMPLDDGREPNTWLVSNQEAACLAMEKWIRVASDRETGAYVVFEYEGAPKDPVWPPESLHELIKLAFKNRLIDRRDHPMILKLRGLG